ncbi:thioredoxin family protein [Polyangium sorediatum]|uniref:Thioredoxin family protein n=1 Tax=Polyangium sorediatum TaxID=889274 RepID=A0ABT6P779_9BACT|nr:thioredoxin family protein [Polyangium sorediatum]MDI1436025.1 thioredoxin family protein [Polyangium sorediatum]
MTLRHVLLLPLLLLACNKEAPAPAPEAKAPEGKTSAAAAAASDKPAAGAEIGKPAPDFTLTDYEGKTHHLADYRGKIVVLEWFNPECPFVKASHTKGSLKGYSKRAVEKGVVWLGINSGAPGKQGHGAERVAEGRKAFGMENPVLADETGKVGHLYGATNTPHMFVIDAQGTLVYRGAIDNSPDGEGESPKDGKLVNHVDAALEDLAAGKPVRTPDTRAYGCSVKYGS